MFYNHEVLTSRKYGIATIWLVATLGAKSNNKKINRKAIQNVDLPKACKTIIEPDVPMALRLQGNLLYGVSRVYLQQSDYVLSDAQAIYNSMHLMLRAVENAALDPDAGKARPEQLILPDDPSFMPEFALPPPELLTQLEMGFRLDPPMHMGDSQSLTPLGSQRRPSTPEAPLGGLILPVSSSARSGGYGGPLDAGFSSAGGASGGILDTVGYDDAISEPGFTFDDNGDLIDFSDVDRNAPTGVADVVRGATMQPDDIASEQVRQEHDERMNAIEEQLDDQMDLDLPILGEELPDADLLTTHAQQQPGNSSEYIESSPAVAAPVRRKQRAARILPVDVTVQLRSKDLLDWNNNYLTNMSAASQAKNQKLLAQQAKQNADYWVWGAGIGGIGSRLKGVSGPTPFDMFMGDQLFEHFTGLDRHASAGMKRDRDSGIDDVTQEESRRVRRKPTDSSEQREQVVEDEAMFIPGGDDVDLPRDEIELPRDAAEALDDEHVFSEMPWNITASIRGSSAVPRSARAQLTGSAGGPSSLTTGRRGVRLTSASPLQGRGRDIELPGFDEGDNSFDDYAGFAGPGFSSDMPDAAIMAADASAPTNHVNEALDAEGENFLDFIADAIDENRRKGVQERVATADANQNANEDEISFEALIPHGQNKKVVASQALMMTLILGTKGLLNVRQDKKFAEIGLSLTEKAKVARLAVPGVVERNEDGDEHEAVGEDNAMAEDTGTHFEEQFVAGHGDDGIGETAGENDSLYGD